MKIKQLKNWITALWHWLGEARVAIMFILVLASVIVHGLFTWSSEDSIRISGFILQFLGMIFAIRGLLRVREHFGHSPLRTVAVAWLKRFPKWKRDVLVHAGSGELVSAVARIRMEVWESDNPERSIDERFAAIYKNFEAIKKEQREHSQSISDLEKNYEAHKKEVEEEQKELERRIQSDRESFHTEDISISLAGLFWLTVGIAMSTMAPELAERFL